MKDIILNTPASMTMVSGICASLLTLCLMANGVMYFITDTISPSMLLTELGAIGACVFGGYGIGVILDMIVEAIIKEEYTTRLMGILTDAIWAVIGSLVFLLLSMYSPVLNSDFMFVSGAMMVFAIWMAFDFRSSVSLLIRIGRLRELMKRRQQKR